MNINAHNTDIEVAVGGNVISYRNKNSYCMAPHEHDELQVIIPFEGAQFDITWALEDKDTETKSLGVGDICIIPPYLSHEVQWANVAHFLSLRISPSFMNESIECGFDPLSDIIEARIGFDDLTLYHLALSARSILSSMEKVSGHYISGVMAVVAQHIVCHYLRAPAEAVLFNNYDQIPCTKIRDAALYMQNHVERSLSVEEIADSVDMSHYHFIRTFKDTMGIPPAKFHMQLRIDKAKVMLKAGKPIVDVALDLGFSSQSHFSSTFSKLVGVTPSQFVKQ